MIHYETLKVYESLGLKITKINDNRWLDMYINLKVKLTTAKTALNIGGACLQILNPQ